MSGPDSPELSFSGLLLISFLVSPEISFSGLELGLHVIPFGFITCCIRVLLRKADLSPSLFI